MVEVLLALIILSLTTVALLTAFGTSINASAEHRSLANFDTVLASSIATTTSVVQQQYADVFNTCQPLSAYPSSAALTEALALPGYTATIAPTGSQPAVEYSSGGSYSTSCTSGTSGDVGNPQLINVVVTDIATRVSQNDTVVVDNPTVIQTTGVSGSTANELVFIRQPEGATINSNFASQPVLEVEDNGVLVTSDLSPITLTIASGPGGASLSQTCTGQETAGIVTYSGCSLNVVGAGYTLFASEPSPSGPGDLTATIAPFSVYAGQLITPTITSVVPSTVAAGAVNVTFTGASNAPVGQAYSAKACQDLAMSVNCVVQTNFASGSDVTGLTPGSSYYVQITAAPSQNYLGSTSRPGGPAMATVALVVTAAPTVTDGATAGSLTISYTGSSNAPSGQTYTLKACTNIGMSTGCVTNTNFTSGTTLTGLPFTPGSPGSTYYATITANASSGYLASPTSPLSAPVTILSSVKTPTLTVTPSATQAGAISVTFASGGGPPTTLTVTRCTDSAMTQNCVTPTGFTSGSQMTGLTPGTTYYVTVTAASTTPGYLSATSATSSAIATVQLTAPVIVSAGYGTTAFSVSVTYTGSSNAPAGETYSLKACTNMNMITGCVPVDASYVSGTDLTGLVNTTGVVGDNYFVQVTANPSTGYLGSVASNQANHLEMSQVGRPGTPAVTKGTNNGSFKVTFTNSTGTAPTSYTVTYCTTNATSGPTCASINNFTSGTTITTADRATNFWVTITANPPVGYVSNASVTTEGQSR